MEIGFWNRWTHNKSANLVRQLSTQEPSTDPNSKARQSLNAYFDDKKCQVGEPAHHPPLRTGKRLFTQAEHLLRAPAQRQAVQAWVRPVLKERCVPYVTAEALLDLCRVRPLLLATLVRTATAESRQGRQQALATVFDNHNWLTQEALLWAEEIPAASLERCTQFFQSDVGQRWLNAMAVAVPLADGHEKLTEAEHGEAHSLAPLIPANSMTKEGLAAAKACLETGDSDVIAAFQDESAGMIWTAHMISTLAQARAFFSEHASELNSTFRTLEADAMRAHLQTVIAPYQSEAERNAALEAAMKSAVEALLAKDG